MAWGARRMSQVKWYLTEVYQRIRARVVLADAEPEFADDGDGVTWKRQTAVEHHDEGSTPRSTVLFEAPGGEDGPEIHRDLPGVSNAQGGIIVIFVFTTPSFDFNVSENNRPGVRGMPWLNRGARAQKSADDSSTNAINFWKIGFRRADDILSRAQRRRSAMARRQFISTLTPGPSSQFQRLDAIVYRQSRADCG